MTEQEWLKGTDPQPILEFLRGKASDRKLRLFAVAAFNCRGFDDRDASKDDVVREAREAAMLAELYADGHLTDQAMGEACTRLFFRVVLKPQAWLAAMQSCWSTINLSCRKGPQAVATMGERLSSQLREVIGNPFRPVTIDRSCLTPKVVALAQSIYTDRTFHQLSLLADELEKAGCSNKEIMAHLRGPGPHVRGCWVVDLILGKE